MKNFSELKLDYEHPKFKLAWKQESGLMKAINWLLGAGKKDSPFMAHYATTVGKTIYMPKAWWHSARDTEKHILLRHEFVHIRQTERLSTMLFLLLYLLILPVGFAYFRTRFEKEAYAETLRARYEYYGKKALADQTYRDWLISQFTGSQYGWMWPFPRLMRKWYDKTVSDILAK